MRWVIRLAWLGLSGYSMVAVGQEASGAAARGAALLAPFKTALMQELVEGLEAGPVAAIGVCRLRAPAIADVLAVDGVRVGRRRHRLRNPANSAPDWVRPLLDRYRDTPTVRGPMVVPLGDGRSGYVEPIMVQPLCLGCHGSALEPAVIDALATMYPDDRATGYELGDLRGVFWVEFP
jgi:hypothetical protein